MTPPPDKQPAAETPEESLHDRCRRIWVCKRCGNCLAHCKHKDESNFHEDLRMPCSVKIAKETQPTAGETLEEIVARLAHRIMYDEMVSNRQALMEVLEAALRNRDERAVGIIDEHQAMDVCKDNCWTTIKKAIREGE